MHRKMEKAIKIGLLMTLSILLFSCSGTRFLNKIHKKSNLQEIIDFKEYLLKKNVMDDFKEYKILGFENDSIIRKFFLKYNIRAMYVEKCNINNDAFSGFKSCGNIITLTFNNIYFIESNYWLIFDYSEEELSLKDDMPKKCKIADRIYAW